MTSTRWSIVDRALTLAAQGKSLPNGFDSVIVERLEEAMMLSERASVNQAHVGLLRLTTGLMASASLEAVAASQGEAPGSALEQAYRLGQDCMAQHLAGYAASKRLGADFLLHIIRQSHSRYVHALLAQPIDRGELFDTL